MMVEKIIDGFGRGLKNQFLFHRGNSVSRLAFFSEQKKYADTKQAK
jgi:hypothetical protein